MNDAGSKVGGAFAKACEQVLEHLKVEAPLDTWAVTRWDGTNQVCLFVRSDSGDLGVGDACHLWPGAHIGVPIARPGGDLFGTICGLDPHSQPADLARSEAGLRLVASLLATILDEDMGHSEVARRLERAEMLADTDELTGIYNRRGWQHYIAHEEERLRRYGDPAGVIVVDLDDLKGVNDRHGHPAGDRLLARAAASIRSAVRSSDVTARLGGDEFGVIANHSNASEVTALAARLRSALAAAEVDASVGFAGYTLTGGLAGAWEAADAAMYAEKRRRRPTG